MSDASSDVTTPPPPPPEEGWLHPYVPIELYRSCMVRTWGLLWYLCGFSLVMKRIKLDEASAERVRQASEAGPVVYVMHTRSLLDYLALNEVLRRRRLPLADYGMGIAMTWWMPVLEALYLLKDKVAWFFRHGRLPNPVDVGWLTRLVAEGGNAAVFLRPRVRWQDFFRPPAWPDGVAAVLDAQRASTRPVQLLPVVVNWGREPQRAWSSTLRALLGSEDDVGWVVKLVGVLSGSRLGLVTVGKAVSASEFLTRVGQEPPPRQSRRLRLLLRRFLWRERQIVRGPVLKSPRWTRRLVLSSARVQRLIEDESLATHRPIASVQEEVLRIYDRMAARFSYAVVNRGRAPILWFWRTVYQGMDVRVVDMEKIRTAQREGVCVLVPCHRSHIDYVLMSTVMHEHDLVMPHVIAGDNLSFWPLGWLLRRFGAVFIKRSFAGERIFPTLFQAYLTQLFRDGYTVEFFIEGGRSRTGKLLPPKLGVLGATVESGLELRLGRDLGEVTYIPVNITYESVAEEGPYAKEMAGARKRPESLGDLLRAAKVIGSRQGRVFLRLGEPQRLSEFLAEQGRDWDELPREHRREALRTLGERIMHRINSEAVVVGPSLAALCLAAQRAPAQPEAELAERWRRFRDVLAAAGAELAVPLDDEGWREGVQSLLQKGLVERIEGPNGAVIATVPNRRLTLEYYKNFSLHYLLPASLVGAAIRARGERSFTVEDLREDLRFLLFLLRYEFVLDPSLDERDLEQHGLSLLERAGALRSDGDRWEVLDPSRVAEQAELTVNFLESTYLVLRALFQLKDRDLNERGLERGVMEMGRQYLAVADLSRPESVSVANVRNALRALNEDGAWRARSTGGLDLDTAVCRQYIESLRRLTRLPDTGFVGGLPPSLSAK